MTLRRFTGLHRLCIVSGCMNQVKRETKCRETRMAFRGTNKASPTNLSMNGYSEKHLQFAAILHLYVIDLGKSQGGGLPCCRSGRVTRRWSPACPARGHHVAAAAAPAHHWGSPAPVQAGTQLTGITRISQQQDGLTHISLVSSTERGETALHNLCVTLLVHFTYRHH